MRIKDVWLWANGSLPIRYLMNLIDFISKLSSVSFYFHI